MYQALYRKWRPSTFDQVIGQEHITQTLKNQIIADKLSHAYLFIGSRGTGKTTCARILSKAVNCEHPVNGNPCGSCSACRTIMESSCTDVVELDAASNNGVDNVRALREEAVFSPASVKYRVYIIDEVHMLSTPAFNALLKILEEPPAHLIFILATTELHKVPATILSRCQRHTFKRIESGKLSDYLQHVALAENISLSKDASDMISVISDGGVRDALSILDQCAGTGAVTADSLLQIMGLAGSDTMFSVLEGILSHNTTAVLEIFKNLWMDGKDPASFIDSLRTLFRDLLLVSSVSNVSSNLLSGRYSVQRLKTYVEKLSYEQIVSAINTVQNAFLGMKYTSNTRLSAEICLISLCDDLLTEDLSSIKSRISQLENKLSALQTGETGIIPSDNNITSQTEITEKVYVKDAFCSTVDSTPQQDASTEEKQVISDSHESSAPAVMITDDCSDFNEKLISSVKAQLPVDLRYSVSNPSDFRFTLCDNLLKIEAEPLLLYGRINRPAVKQIFAKTASEILGRDVNVSVTVLEPKTNEIKSAGKLEELKRFPEVKIIE